jgi:replicative superfamily II helicase
MIVKRNAPSETCQHSGLVLRDAWIEFSQAVRKVIGEIDTQLGKNDVKAVVEALKLDIDLTQRAKDAYSSTLDLQHDRKAGREKAEKCFNASATAMAEIIKARFPDQHDPGNDELIRPN